MVTVVSMYATNWEALAEIGLNPGDSVSGVPDHVQSLTVVGD